MLADRRPNPTFAMLLVAIALLALAGAAGAQPYATDKVDKPFSTLVEPAREAFDCSGAIAVELAPGGADSLTGDTTDSVNVIEGYSCRANWLESGPEHIYELNVTERLELFAGLRDLDAGGDPIDLDLFLLDACDTDSCLVGANIELTAVLEPGTYYLVVDGFDYPEPQAGPYGLVYDCRWPGMAPAVCEPGYATEVFCASIPTVEGNLYDQPNYLQTFDCSAFVTRGGEQWYEVHVPGWNTLTVSLTEVNLNLDASLWIFAGCGADAECLSFVDEKTSGEVETTSWTNQDHGGAVVLVGVDCIRPLTEPEEGAYAVEFFCEGVTETETTSFGSMRALYR